MELKVEIDTFLGPASRFRCSSKAVESESWPRAPMRPCRRSSQTPETAIATIPSESEERLSHEQQLLWYAHQFTPNSAAYHISGAATIRVELELDAFRRAFRAVVAQQERCARPSQ